MESQGNPIPLWWGIQFPVADFAVSYSSYFSPIFAPTPSDRPYFRRPPQPDGAPGGARERFYLTKYQKCDLGLALAPKKNQLIGTRN